MEHAVQMEQELCLLVEALAVLETSGRDDLLSEAYRLQGELVLQSGVQRLESEVLAPATGLQTPDDEAEACFQQALTLARRRQAKSWKLRAAMSLSRLWQRQGRDAEAQALLAAVYNWFTEGFDTADLQEARALLQALSGEKVSEAGC